MLESTPIHVTFGILARLPSIVDVNASSACRGGQLLACAFATWVKKLHIETMSIGILFDCGSSGDTQNISVPEQWISAVPVSSRPVIRSSCLHGGVCLGSVGRGSKRCARGSRALLRFLAEAFPHTALFVKVDSDTVVFPARLRGWLLSQIATGEHVAPGNASTLAAARHFYAGNAEHSINFNFCDGVINGPFPGGRAAARNRTCARSTADWAKLEASIGSMPNSAERQAIRNVCANPPPGSAGQVVTPTQPRWRDLSEDATGPRAVAAAAARWLLPSLKSQDKPLRCGSVKYAGGGAYVLSRFIVESIVAHDCIARVSAVRCRGWANNGSVVGGGTSCEWSLEHEDAAVGLCAHLVSNHDLATSSAVKSTPCFNRRGTQVEGCSTSRILTTHPIKLASDYLSFWEGIAGRVS